MISELAFSRNYSSFWRSMAPACDLFVRRINLDGYERFDAPMRSSTAPNRRGLVNDAAFSLFLRFAATAARFRSSDVANTDVAAVAPPLNPRNPMLSPDATNIQSEITPEELTDAREQVGRITKALGGGAALQHTVCQPFFPGCGILNQCWGDILLGRTLYEVKAGDRNFRSIDVRQLLTYAALNFEARSYRIEKLGLINPRSGITFDLGIEDVCAEVSGRSAAELLSAIVYHLSSGEISR